MLKDLIEQRNRKSKNKRKVQDNLRRLHDKIKRKVFSSVLRHNQFEANWLYNVRFELYQAQLLEEIIWAMKVNIKHNRVERMVNANRGIKFFEGVRERIDFLNTKAVVNREKIEKRQLRKLLRALRRNV